MELCRICDRPSSEVRNIFSKNVDGKQILQLIRETLPTVIYRNDPLSKHICLSCLENVDKIHNFRKSCLKVVDNHKETLKGNQNKDVLLYLQLLDSIDQKELWMYSSPIKKTFNKETPMCFNCKTEIFSPKTEKPFKKYKELPRKSDDGDSLTNGYDDYELSPNIHNKRKRLPIVDLESITAGSLPKRKKIIGPKCVSRPFIKSSYTETKTYNPLNLLNLALNVVNKSIVPDIITEPLDYYEENICIEEELTYACEYCMEVFDDQNELAKHELKHMKINLTRVDNIEIWNTSFEESSIRNKWLRNLYGDEYLFDENEEDENLLVPLSESGDEMSGDIELVDTKPVVNGVSLADIPKSERRLYYNRNYVVNGIKRKFCPLCRYTFKDNWAIELHYFSSACYYACRYCGIRFNKQRAIFDEHVNLHIQRGDPISDKVYASKKKNDPIPKVLCQGNSRTSVCISPLLPESGTPKLRVIKPKPIELENSVVESEQNPPTPTTSGPTTSGGQSQAYFCRKCYKVFFMLNEFNQHTEICQGIIEDEKPNISQDRKLNISQEKKPTPVKVEPKPPPKYHRGVLTMPASLKLNEATIKISSTGRPVRNCVRDVKYKDHLDIDIESEENTNTRPKPAAQTFDFECVVCHAIFPTMLSRNSHMRVHKNGYKPPAHKQESHYNNTYESYDEVVSFKQEPLEPLVEIHETNTEPEQELSSNIGAVSITPIPNKRHRTQINPDIMRLVQSNPNITIRTMTQSPLEPQTLLTEGGSGSDDGVRTYKCSSCNQSFTSKSTLYFHKKHQCEGSRFPCPFCKKRFGTESAYSAHIFYSHPE
ncbi:uncharacterized protein [Onthophagus taurus]|uniref:uncharacterized protein n=1 Tax=Onthophagus taurus TaxID=166361 RepID=UPI000C205EAB|nr:uncharacterized protein LOC111429103 [Onthophagus taurus]